MAKIKATLMRKLHTQMGAILDEFETNSAAERAAAGGVDNDPTGQAGATPAVRGAQDSAPRKSMSEAFPGFDRIRK